MDEVFDARAEAILWEWATALHELGKAILQAEHAACYGPGQAEVRTRQRFGDPVPSRLQLEATQPYIRDEDLANLRRLRENALGRLGYHLAWLQRELTPPEGGAAA